MAKTTSTTLLTTVGLWMVVAAVVLVSAGADEAPAMAPDMEAGSPAPAEGGWTDSMKEKAGEAADGVKSWKDWAVGKFHEKWNGESPAPAPAPTTTDRLGETNERMASGHKAQKHGPSEL